MASACHACFTPHNNLIRFLAAWYLAMAYQIPLTRGQFALVDAHDYKILSRHRWHCTANGYAARTVVKRKRRKTVYMHRVILKAPRVLQVDHINGDPLDNRRDNLRLVTPQQNLQNSAPRRNRSSRYKGVSRHRKRWQARIWVDNHSLHLGTFSSELHAAAVYDRAAMDLLGPYARLNLSDGSPRYGNLDAFLRQMQRIEDALTPVQPRIERRPSPYRGVYWHRCRWRAVIRVDGHKRHLGYFTDELKAAHAYDTAARAAHGPKAIVNFPTTQQPSGRDGSAG